MHITKCVQIAAAYILHNCKQVGHKDFALQIVQKQLHSSSSEKDYHMSDEVTSMEDSSINFDEDVVFNNKQNDFSTQTKNVVVSMYFILITT